VLRWLKRGTVRDAARKAVAGVRVQAFDKDLERVAQASALAAETRLPAAAFFDVLNAGPEGGGPGGGARVATGQPPFYDVAVYHCQQAAEKAVEAFLVHHGTPYEKTHDIEVLTDLACEVGSNFSRLADAAAALTPYATRFRYPNATFAVEPQPAEYDGWWRSPRDQGI